MLKNSSISILLLLIFTLPVSARFGARFLEDQGVTQITVYATDAGKVSLRLYSSEEASEFQEFKMVQARADMKSLTESLRENSYTVRLPGNYTGHWYTLLVDSKNKITPRAQGNQLCVPKGHDLFVFHPKIGYVMGTTARGFIQNNVDGTLTDLAGEFLRKDSQGNEDCFQITNSTTWKDYHVEFSPEGSFPKRLNSYELLDPYCYVVSADSKRCKIFDFENLIEFPESGKRIGVNPGHTIHEVHLKDLTWLLEGVPEELKGTYLGAVHPKTLQKLKELEVSSIEFLPLHQFDRNAAPPGHINYWGYMTQSFFAMHRAYAQDPERALFEFKEMVQKYHEVGISVILDVVYNHTSEGDHRGPLLGYKSLARDEYYRMWDPHKGLYDNATGVGNTCKTESEVMRKLILDSLDFFYNDLQVDGFRFDLAAAMDKETLRQVREKLGEEAFLSGEPWVAAGSPQWNRVDLNEIRFGKWNDQYRKAIKGSPHSPGFINGEGNETDMKVLVRGEHRHFGGSGSYVDAYPGNANPEGVVNEVEVHDGHTLYDHLKYFKISDSEKQKRIRLAHTLLLTSVSTPILHLGQEFARTKKGNHNSYDQDSDINWIDWNRMEQYRELSDFTATLKKFRLHYDAFQFQDRVTDDRLIFVEDSSNNQCAFGYIMRGSEYRFLVLVNGSTNSGADFHFDDSVWDVVSNGKKASNRSLGKVQHGHYFLGAGESAILRQKVQ